MSIKRNIFPSFFKMIPGADPGAEAAFAQWVTESLAAPAPAPAPAPPPAAPAPAPGSFGAAPVQTGTTRGGAPVDQYGNRMDTEAGRAKSLQMMEAQQKNVATEAYKVAASEASFGRAESAQTALAAAQTASDRYISGEYRNRDTFRGGPGSGQGQTLVPLTSAQRTADQNLQSFIDASRNTAKNIQGMIDNLPKPTTPTTPTTTPKPTPQQAPTPFNPIFTGPVSPIAPPSPVLIPSRDVINFETPVASPEAMIELLFEQIAGYELINIARRDTIDGQNPAYTLISNLSSIRRNLNPAQIISAQKPFQTGFERYEINLSERIPGDQYLLDNNLENFYYIASNGDLVIELNNLSEDEEIEVQMAVSGKIT